MKGETEIVQTRDSNTYPFALITANNAGAQWPAWLGGLANENSLNIEKKVNPQAQTTATLWVEHKELSDHLNQQYVRFYGQLKYLYCDT